MSTVSLRSAEGKWVMVSAIMASAMAFIDATALNVVLPALQKDLHATGADLFWLLNAYLLMLASLILIGGAMGDKLGRKKIFMVGIALFILGSVACGFAPTIGWLIIFRSAQGVGGALMIPGSLSLISSAIDAGERGKAIGTWSSVTTVVTMGGPVLGGALADAGLWRYIFFINIPIGVVALLILFFRVKESKDSGSSPSPDFPGAITIVLGLALITVGFLRIPAAGLTNWQVFIPLIAGILLTAAFIYIEKRSKYPMMPLHLFSNKTFTGANLLTFFLYAALGAGMLFLSLNLVQMQGYSQLQSGLTFLPFTILMVTIARFAGAMADKHGPRLLLILGPALAGAGLLWLSFVKQTHGPQDYFITFFPGVIFLGLGMSLTVAPLTATVMGSISDHFSGTASGVNNAMTRIANVFANAIFGALAVLFFSGVLRDHIKSIPLDTSDRYAVMTQTANLGNAKIPAGIDRKNARVIESAYHESFIAAYSRIMRISASLAFLGAFMSYIFISNVSIKTARPYTRI